jgi:ammonium transporter, Amt family
MRFGTNLRILAVRGLSRAMIFATTFRQVDNRGGPYMMNLRPTQWGAGIGAGAIAVFLIQAGDAMAATVPKTFTAPPATKIDSGDTAWVLVAAALVLLMTAPGLALFYGGMVRRKNVLATLMQSFILAGLITIQWVLFGYSLAFSPDHHGLIGGLSWLGLNSVGSLPNPDYAATIPHSVYMLFQCMFAIITPALITGAIAERVTFRGFVLFSLLWATFIYDPLAHWVWGSGGWLHQLGALDFAGGTVVHISSGISALAAAMILGRRIGYPDTPITPHNLTMTVTGAGLLWFGWFGFNAGSALAANGLAASAMVATHIAAAAASVSWMGTEWITRGKPTVLGAASGAVAGLVGITPASGYVTPMAALIIGLVAGAVCFFAVGVKFRFGYDDSLDVVGVHCVGGITGALLTGIFASRLINPAGNDGLFNGNPNQFLIQVVAVAATIAFAFVGTLILLKVVDVLVGLRVDDGEEQMGLDLSQHSEVGYALED